MQYEYSRSVSCVKFGIQNNYRSLLSYCCYYYCRCWVTKLGSWEMIMSAHDHSKLTDSNFSVKKDYNKGTFSNVQVKPSSSKQSIPCTCQLSVLFIFSKYCSVNPLIQHKPPSVSNRPYIGSDNKFNQILQKTRRVLYGVKMCFCVMDSFPKKLYFAIRQTKFNVNLFT